MFRSMLETICTCCQAFAVPPAYTRARCSGHQSNPCWHSLPHLVQFGRSPVNHWHSLPGRNTGPLEASDRAGSSARRSVSRPACGAVSRRRRSRDLASASFWPGYGCGSLGKPASRALWSSRACFDGMRSGFLRLIGDGRPSSFSMWTFPITAFLVNARPYPAFR